MKFLLRASLFTFVLTALFACGGGGGRSSQPAPVSAAPPGPPPSAKVSVLLTDAAGRRWDQAFATISSIELLGDDGGESIFNGSETVDLLSLPDFYELFSVDEDVAPGDFNKVRLMLDRLELVDLDDMGMEIERVDARIVGKGKIDINPQGMFTIAAGDVLFIEIDFDMNKAFKTTETGNGQVIVRPVVFANITARAPPDRLTRIFGVVQSIDEADRSLVLCQTGLVADSDDDDDADDSADDDRECLRVALDDRTGIFDADGMPIGLADIMVDDELTAVGFLRKNENENDEAADDDGIEDDFFLEAVVLELGNFERYEGVVDTPVDADLFDFALALRQGFESDTVIATQLFEGTRVFSSSGEELDATAIVPETTGIVDGVIALGSGDESDTLRAAFIVLDTGVAEEEVLRGEITSVNPDEGTLQLLVDETDRCVDAGNADIFVVSEGDGVSSERAELADLVAGQQADAFGEEGADGCFIATDILAEAVSEDDGNTPPVADAGEDQTVTTGESVMLDGSGSSDADGDDLSYSWTLTAPDGSTAELVDADTAMPSFTTDVDGDYVVELTVNDGQADTEPVSVTVTAS